MAKFLVKYEVKAEGYVEVEAEDELAATDLVDNMGLKDLIKARGGDASFDLDVFSLEAEPAPTEKVMVMMCDADNIPRAWARGEYKDVAAVEKHARAQLKAYVKKKNKLGEGLLETDFHKRMEVCPDDAAPMPGPEARS